MFTCTEKYYYQIQLVIITILTSDSQHKRSNAPSTKSPLVDEERMRPGQWLEFVLFIAFSALTLMVGWHKGHPDHKKLSSINQCRFFSGTGEGGGPEGERGKWMLNGSSS